MIAIGPCAGSLLFFNPFGEVLDHRALRAMRADRARRAEGPPRTASQGRRVAEAEAADVEASGECVRPKR